MAGEFTVKVLPSDEFDKLPFKRIQDNPSAVFGAADQKNRIAYVRDTGFNDFTKANIGHELDELMAQTSPHEEDGIRYKDFSQSFGNFLGNIPVIGKGASALGRFAGSGIDKLGSLTGNAFNIGAPSPTQSAGNLFSAPPLVGSDQGGRAVSGIPDVRGGNIPSGSSFPGFGTGFGSSLISNEAAGGSIPGISFGSSFPTSLPNFNVGAPKAPSFLDQVLSGAGNVFKGGGTGTGGGDVTFGEKIGSVLPGAAVSLLGNLFAPKVEAPDFSGIREDLAGKIGEGGSPAFDLGFGEAKRQLGTEPGTIPPAVLAEIDLRRDEEIRALEDRFRINQQGGGISESDTSRFGTLRNDIVERYERLKQQTEFDYQNAQEARRITTMSELFGLDQAQFAQYEKLAQLDVSELMIKTGIDAQTAMQFKELFGNIGGQLISSGLGQNNQSPINLNVNV
jgi:hypothetical protein